MKTEAMSLTVSRWMMASIRRTSSTKLCSSSRALRTFTKQSHDEVRGCIKGGSGKGGRKDLRHRISHLQQRYFLNLDREIIASTSDRALDAFVLSDNMWGVFAHAPVDTEAFIETLPDKVRRIQSAPRFHRD
ncbi:hypothetical protein Tco_1368910 [Tanacetum coccineum]